MEKAINQLFYFEKVKLQLTMTSPCGNIKQAVEQVSVEILESKSGWEALCCRNYILLSAKQGNWNNWLVRTKRKAQNPGDLNSIS